MAGETDSKQRNTKRSRDFGSDSGSEAEPKAKRSKAEQIPLTDEESGSEAERATPPSNETNQAQTTTDGQTFPLNRLKEEFHLLIADNLTTEDPGNSLTDTTSFRLLEKSKDYLLKNYSNSQDHLGIVKDIRAFHNHSEELRQEYDYIVAKCASVEFFPTNLRNDIADLVCSAGEFSQVPLLEERIQKSTSILVSKAKYYNQDYRTKIFDAATLFLPHSIGIEEQLYAHREHFLPEEQKDIDRYYKAYNEENSSDSGSLINTSEPDLKSGSEYADQRADRINAVRSLDADEQPAAIKKLLNNADKFEAGEIREIFDIAKSIGNESLKAEAYLSFVEKVGRDTQNASPIPSAVTEAILKETSSFEPDNKAPLIREMLRSRLALDPKQYGQLYKMGIELPVEHKVAVLCAVSEAASARWGMMIKERSRLRGR